MLTPENVVEVFINMGEHLTRVGTHNHKVYTARGMEMPGHPCEECHNEVDYFMLTEETWASVAVPRTGTLCFTCTEKHLGRPLKIEDFSAAAVNRPILLGMRMGLEAGKQNA